MRFSLHYANLLGVAHDDLLTAAQAGALLGLSGETVRRWAEDKRIAHILLPSGGRRYRRSEIERILRGIEAKAKSDERSA